MATKEEWAWVAGLIEGEGCIGVYSTGRTPKGQRNRRATVAVQMCDRDVVERLHRVTNVGSVYSVEPHNGVGIKLQWAWKLQAQGDVCRVLFNCLPWFGERRTIKANEASLHAERLLEARGNPDLWEVGDG